ncbi:hypothetical protein LAZ67_21001466 [Cordylochernes scorpioides]|uniref:Uncharacterized protein n=1 Tax=Cordylochernes scorpioides TaxID=51811 RepID=A0ABY6LMH4_9ARAC|nr:hypothetical protein LAZ67_21001466 [Cordylochernes scorpioides]
MESDPDSESGGSLTFPKKENTLGRTQEVPPGQEDVTPPPPVSDVLGSLARTIYQLSSATGLSRDVELSRYDGSYEAQSFFTNYDAQADRAQLQYSTRLRKPPNLLQAPLRVTNTRAREDGQGVVLQAMPEDPGLLEDGEGLYDDWPDPPTGPVARSQDITDSPVTKSRQDSGRQGTSKQIDHCLYRKMEQGREENPKEPMESDPDSESGGSLTFPKKENTLGRTQEVPPGQEDVTPPPPVSDVLGSLARTIYQLSSATGLSRDVELSRYDGSYEAQSFFTNYDAQADRAQLQYSTRLRKPPNLLQAPLRVTNTRAREDGQGVVLQAMPEDPGLLEDGEGLYDDWPDPPTGPVAVGQ